MVSTDSPCRFKEIDELGCGFELMMLVVGFFPSVKGHRRWFVLATSGLAFIFSAENRALAIFAVGRAGFTVSHIIW
jgi:hypothetical protein